MKLSMYNVHYAKFLPVVVLGGGWVVDICGVDISVVCTTLVAEAKYGDVN